MIATADPKPRIAARAVLALALFAFLVFEVVKHGHWAPALVGMLGPDIALLGGMGGGRLNPRAVPLYNVLHMYWLPVALMAVAATGVAMPPGILRRSSPRVGRRLLPARRPRCGACSACSRRARRSLRRRDG